MEGSNLAERYRARMEALSTWIEQNQANIRATAKMLENIKTGPPTVDSPLLRLRCHPAAHTPSLPTRGSAVTETPSYRRHSIGFDADVREVTSRVPPSPCVLP